MPAFVSMTAARKEQGTVRHEQGSVRKAEGGLVLYVVFLMQEQAGSGRDQACKGGPTIVQVEDGLSWGVCQLNGFLVGQARITDVPQLRERNRQVHVAARTPQIAHAKGWRQL